jgi:excisionase family DNA binding protein
VNPSAQPSPARPLTRADVMTATSVAELLGVKKSTVEDWARRGVIPSRKRGRRRIFLRWEVEAWVVAADED